MTEKIWVALYCLKCTVEGRTQLDKHEVKQQSGKRAS